MKFLIAFATLAFASTIHAATVDCPSNYPNGSTLKYSDGSMNFPNGSTFRYSDGSMNYPSGSTFRYRDGSMNYPNGSTMRYSDGSMNYPNGSTMRYRDGSINNSNGSTNQTGSVSATVPAGQGQLVVRARKETATFQLTVPTSKFTVTFNVSEDGSVVCDLDGNPKETPNEFRIEGSKGSADVKVKPGNDPEAIKRAIESVLGN